MFGQHLFCVSIFFTWGNCSNFRSVEDATGTTHARLSHVSRSKRSLCVYLSTRTVSEIYMYQKHVWSRIRLVSNVYVCGYNNHGQDIIQYALSCGFSRLCLLFTCKIRLHNIFSVVKTANVHLLLSWRRCNAFYSTHAERT